MEVAWDMVLIKTAYGVLMLLAVLTFAGYAVLAERKVSAWIQGRVGPNRTSLPILGDIPLLGGLFRRSDVRIQKPEWMVFITPHVVYTDEDATRVTGEQKSKLHYGMEVSTDEKQESYHHRYWRKRR